MAIEKQPSCDDEMEPELLPVETALRRIAGQINPLSGANPQDRQQLALRESLGRVVAVDITSPIDVPGYTNSAMDGYAVRSADIPDAGEAELTVIGTAWAGRPVDDIVTSGQAVRIMTGGLMPCGTDTVIIQEHVQSNGAANGLETITIDGTTSAGRNVRNAGEDIKTGEVVISAGTLITAAHVGLVASLGIDQVPVLRQLKVAFFSTGDELRALEQFAGQTLAAGELFDSNRHTIFAMLTRLGVELIDLGVIEDTAAATRGAFEKAAAVADVIISSGGVSAGQADFVSATLAEIGEVTFWKLAMRPGRPLACGKVGNAHFFGLPGNPVAVMVTFYEFVQPAIKTMMGCSETQSPVFSVASGSKIRKVKGRIEYQRGIVSTQADGTQVVHTTGKQGAGRLTSMCMANCLIVLPVECDGVEVGDAVKIQPFSGLT